MKTSFDCLPCLIRQTLHVARMTCADPAVHERIVREALRFAGEMSLDVPPPVLERDLRRHLSGLLGAGDPYREAKAHQNRMVLGLLPELRAEIEAAADPLAMAVRLAIAGNVIDMGTGGNTIGEEDVRRAVRHALDESFVGDWEPFRRAVGQARNILYLADNAGEIVFDRLLIERLGPERVTLAVRGGPVLNDATIEDACAAGLCDLVEVIGNGSDIAGTVLGECSPVFLQRLAGADLIIAKGQGNFETLSEERCPVYFLFKVKCPMVAVHAGMPLGTHVLMKGPVRPAAANEAGEAS